MPGYLDTHSLQYLPVDVCGQMFAIPMSEVAAVRRLSDDDAATYEPVNKGAATIPVVDLRRLFFPVKRQSPERPSYVVVISMRDLTYVVLVDDVRPARRVEPADQLPIPPLLAGRQYPFSSVIRVGDSLMLMIHCRLLAEELRQVKSGLVMEQSYGS
jgi:chemotaxis signal transduction protein